VKLVRTLLTAVLVTSPLLAQESRPGTTLPGVSWSLSESLQKKLESIELRKKQGIRRAETVLVTEGEVNSYLNLYYAPKLPPGVTDLELRLVDRERISARGQVDLERVNVKQKVQTSRLNPLSFLGGKVPVTLSGRFQNRDGFGSIAWEEVTIASIPMPITVLEQMVQSSTKTASQPDGFDIHAPFRLPYSLNRVRLEAGRAFLEF
jgi:hypothetical protein